MFHIRSTNKKDVIGESSKEYRIEVFSPSSASDSSNTHLSTDSDSTQTSISADWLDKVSAYSYLDGKFFKPVKLLEENKKVHGQCQLCLPKVTIIKAQLGVSTNFLMHLRRNHGRAIEDYNTHKASKLSKNLSKSNRECTNGDLGEDSGPPLKRQKKITDTLKHNASIVSQEKFDRKVLSFIINTMTPLNIVDNPSFVSLFEGMGVTVMHRTTAVKRINALVAEHITEVRNDLSLAAYVCTTADVWSTKQRSFFGVTAHWINDTYERCSVALACRRFNGSHTYDKVSGLLEDIHSQFNLDLDKLVATVSDNGSNFVKAFKEFGPTSSEEETVDGLVDEEFELLISNSNTLPKHVRCASHTLNLIATVDVKNAIQKIRRYEQEIQML